jgi:hypothetical protein
MTRRAALLGVLAACLVGGCKRATPATPPAAVVPPDPDVPSPDPSRMTYDAATGVLTLHALPPKGEWVVRHDSGTRYPVTDLECRLPPESDPAKVEIYYQVPGVRPSNAIRLRNVVSAHSPPPEP